MRVFLHALLLAIVLPLTAAAADQPASDDAAKQAAKPAPQAHVYTSKHQIKLDGKTIKYTAKAGTMLMKNDEGEPIALIGFTAYVNDETDPRTHPIIFAYNGGPGSASLWLHMGVLGPQRVAIKDASFTDNGPFKRVSNDYSIIDKADLVMIDPVGTGFAKAVGKGKGEDFWGVDQDIQSVGNFIAQYVTENERWASPKYILGESYGGMRSAGVSYYLLNHHNLALNGLVLVSPFLDFATGFDFGGVDLPHVLFLPTFASTAYYHHALPEQPADRDAFLNEVEDFAVGEYASALMQGAALDEATRKDVIDKLHRYTGISKEYWDRANLRVGHQQFTKELLRDRGETVGRIDSRYTGGSIGLNRDTMVYDPMTTAIGPSFLAAFMDYYSRDLQVPADQNYVVSGNVFTQWDWSHAQPGFGMMKIPTPNTVPDLSYAMTQNPHMRVLFLAGYYDLATPFFTTEYLVRHLDISKKLRANIQEAYFDAGHMMYVNPDSLAKFKKVVAGFIQ
jgi:carboxypeptidase C (cathepsin A)